jgi:tryptophan 2,3-dioxygenase
MPDPDSAATQGLTYAGYLRLDRVLSAQQPLSGEHDEMLFIVIHQASELWMKLSLHELAAARAWIAGDRLGPALKAIARVARVQTQLIQSWDVLSTLTPADYAAFRASLGTSSGFQSVQYRLLECLLGGKDLRMLGAHAEDAAAVAVLTAALGTPSLYDEALRLLARRGLPVPAGAMERDWSAPYVADAGVEAAWLAVCRDPARWWDLYDLAEKLIDLEFRFQQWRFAHLKTVERIIGAKTGTGGSAGVPYLSRALEGSFFPELLSLRARL